MIDFLKREENYLFKRLTYLFYHETIRYTKPDKPSLKVNDNNIAS